MPTRDHRVRPRWQKERVAIGNGLREPKDSWKELLLDLKARGLQLESTFATVRHRITRTRNCVSRVTFLGFAFKLVEKAEKSWRRIRSAERIDLLLKGVPFKNGIAVQDNPLLQQNLAA